MFNKKSFLLSIFILILVLFPGYLILKNSFKPVPAFPTTPSPAFTGTVSPSIVPQATGSDGTDKRCQLNPDPGPCKARFVSFYFDKESGSCSEFVWGGCQGTRPFETLQECESACEKTPSPTKSPSSGAKDGCVISGCSSEICSEKEMFSACILRPENECYKTATCEKQENGKCAWTQTSELTSCLETF